MKTIATPFRLSLLALPIAAGLALPADVLAQPKQGGTVVYANLSGPGTLDPHVAASLVELEIIHHIFETLVAIDANYNTKPSLADTVTTSDDAKTFTFTLRKGVKFQNGKEMTSADVLASFERYKRISPNASVLADVERFETPDPYTFIVRLTKTNAVFVDVLKSPVYPFAIIPAEQRDKPARELDIIGTGPFTLGEWVKDSHLVLKRFDGYVADTRSPGPDGLAGRRTAYLDSVRYNFVPEANTRVAAVQSGGADVVSDIPPDLAKRLDGRPDLSVLKIFPFCMQVYVVNTQQGPTKNPLVRQAIASVVNASDTLEAMGVLGQATHSLVYASSPYYQGDAMKPYYSQNNPAKAKELLKKAGYAGEKITLQTNSNYVTMRSAILVLSEQMKAAGMNVAVDVVDWTTNASNMQRGTGTWNVSTTGFCSNPLLGPQQWKVMFYTFPHVQGDGVLDGAYDRFYTSLDPKLRVAAWADIEKRVLDQAYMIKIGDTGTIRAFNNKKVEGFTPYYLPRFWNVSVK
ncbi:ABC transporter substrate-binding protein [Vineibacter terrae]|uniref:ABC transporter substrate-binding protein n=1 Tax=Vineibacter terrae TaxID=2586908 RepID=A0A5C8P706_9HYPH|nr:ABC transporter substrate-binding protein [Vineibacter terrae]TXL69539.1 ABC transporter substrate-binding protein [Vineibacter terrae]